MWLDGLIVYRGGVPMVGAPAAVRAQGGAVGKGAPESGEHAILFSNDPSLTRRLRDKTHYCGATECDVLCINEGQVQIRARHTEQAPDPCAHGVWAAHHSEAQRPMTSLGRG